MLGIMTEILVYFTSSTNDKPELQHACHTDFGEAIWKLIDLANFYYTTYKVSCGNYLAITTRIYALSSNSQWIKVGYLDERLTLDELNARIKRDTAELHARIDT